MLAHSVGAIQSYGTREAGLNAGELRSCNAGIAVAKINKRALGLNKPVTRPRGKSLLPPKPNLGHAFGTSGHSDVRSTGHSPGTQLGQRHLSSPGVQLPPDTISDSNFNVPDIGQAGNPFRGKGGVPPIHMGPQPPDTVNTGQLSLVAKPQPPDTIDTGQLSLVAKPQPPDVVDTRQLSLISKTQIPDIVPTGPLILKSRGL